MMKKLKVLGLAALTALATAATTHAATTNILQLVGVNFTVYTQGTSKIEVGSLNTKGIITALGTDTAISGVPAKGFSSSAYLALVRTVSVAPAPTTVAASATLTTTSSALVVIDGSTIVTIPSDVINVQSTTGSTLTNSSDATVEIDTLTVNIPGQWNFSASGLGANAPQKISFGKAGSVTIKNATLNVAGTGTCSSSATCDLAGKITTSYLKTVINKVTAVPGME
jgi:hypothetical protein